MTFRSHGYSVCMCYAAVALLLHRKGNIACAGITGAASAVFSKQRSMLAYTHSLGALQTVQFHWLTCAPLLLID